MFESHMFFSSVAENWDKLQLDVVVGVRVERVEEGWLWWFRLRRRHQRRHVCLHKGASQAREGTTFFAPNSQDLESSHATTMATQQDLQELLRLQTARKMPMKDAMAQIKALQGASLKRQVTPSAANRQTRWTLSNINQCPANRRRTIENSRECHQGRESCTVTTECLQGAPEAHAGVAYLRRRHRETPCRRDRLYRPGTSKQEGEALRR